jgi:SAM-dependent methyltransferase
VFRRDQRLYRQVNEFGRNAYDRLMNSGLYDDLVKSKLLVSHQEVTGEALEPESAYKILAPETVPFVSYPYEWCFGQLKSAALVTLEIQKRALQYDMSLKDASAYNIQFIRGRPVCIDTLSLEEHSSGRPWTAYGQFCRHFLAPLILMAYRDVRLSQLLKVHLDGIPLDLTSRLLPWYTKLRPSLLAHIHLHSRSERHFESTKRVHREWKTDRNAQLGLLDNLKSILEKLEWRPVGTLWAAYYDKANNTYSETAERHKLDTVAKLLEESGGGPVWDLGANTGRFSRLAAKRGMFTISFDFDPAAVELNHAELMRVGETNVLPLVLDLFNPSPAIGWNNDERTAIWDRGRPETILVLALIHHLAISNHLSFSQIAHFLAQKCRHLIIEFVPPSDSMVKTLFSGRESNFADYRQDRFENAFSQAFRIKRREVLEDSERTIYLMETLGR